MCLEMLCCRLQFFVGAVVKQAKHIDSPQFAYIVSRDLDNVFGISHDGSFLRKVVRGPGEANSRK